MLIINAEDFGMNRLATDRMLYCYKKGTVLSTSVMVFMEDSQRAADLYCLINLYKFDFVMSNLPH